MGAVRPEPAEVCYTCDCDRISGSPAAFLQPRIKVMLLKSSNLILMSNKTAIAVDRWVAERVREFIEVQILTYITATAGGKADSEA